MEHLGNKVIFSADEVETYGVGLDGALKITLKQDIRTDPAYNLEEQDMPKINGSGVPSYEGHEGTVQSASGLLYDVDPAEGEPVGGHVTGPINATNPHAGPSEDRDDDDRERKQELRNREVGLVTPLEEQTEDQRTDEQKNDDEAAGNERKGDEAAGNERKDAEKPAPLKRAAPRK